MTLKTDKQTAAMTILQKAVCLTLTRHYLGNDRKVDLAEVVGAAAPERAEGEQLAVDAQQFRVTKKLIPQEHLRPVMHAVYASERYLRRVAIPAFKVFGDRTYLIPEALIEEVDAELVKFEAAIWVEARKLSERYEAAVEEQRAKLGPLFHESEYLTKEQVRTAFSCEHDYVSFASPEKLVTVNRAIAARAKDRFETRLAGAYNEVVAGLRASALDIVTALDDRLDVGKGERPKVLRPTALKDLEEFVRYLPKRNLGDDDSLAAVMERLSKRAAGLTVEQLRDDPDLRKGLQTAAAEAKKALAWLVEDAPRRAISFGRIAPAA